MPSLGNPDIQDYSDIGDERSADFRMCMLREVQGKVFRTVPC